VFVFPPKSPFPFLPFAGSSELSLEDTFVRLEKYSSGLDIFRSFIRISELSLEDTFVRLEKYSSGLDIFRSLIRIFADSKI